jgi:hypothetical protein
MSAAQIDAVIAKLRSFVAAGSHRGTLLEAVKSAPRGTQMTGAERVGAWLRKSGARKPAPWLPADYRHFVTTWGSLTWMAPAHDAPEKYWFYLGNVGDKALIDLNQRFDIRECAEAIGREDDKALDQILVFHDGYNQGFAFDARVKQREVLVVPFVEGDIERFLTKRPKPVGTFAQWLDARVDGCIRALESVPPVVSTSAASTKVPATIKVPAKKGIKLAEPRADVDKGWVLLRASKFVEVAKLARSALELDPVFMYAHAQLLDALAGLVKTAKDPDAVRKERWTVAWTLLALARRGVDDIHEDYYPLFAQKALTVLAELALEAPQLVPLAQGKKLIAEAARVRVDKDSMSLIGAWDTPGVRKRLDKAK